ncbi:IpaD/SipD/SspD family type III secretion system needle tip protein [Robbsia sp. Bb-Pol-6]|uniref:Translocator protein BipD n=1 Tax=Robbsia betulipollinis TaxID=2981849 RepID=A0ABT3ZL17_9BURK|nr:IpaD/SipD/SspD family type III secretion system needle tip protein [Robbsia betulipollinis]MCY0387235.1 IpaD/SipD/SspD family type III secretion system needle tip protein [Robbsia betulipollinis]
MVMNLTDAARDDIRLRRDMATFPAQPPAARDAVPDVAESGALMAFDPEAIPGGVVARLTDAAPLRGLTDAMANPGPTTGTAPLADPSTAARRRLQRILDAAVKGETGNIGLAIQSHRAAQAQAFATLQDRVNTRLDVATPDRQARDASPQPARGSESGLGASAAPAPTPGAQAGDADRADDPAANAPVASDPPTDTPAAVDAITIDTLDDLKAYYAQYAAAYQTLAAYIEANSASDPEGCKQRSQAFADQFSAPLIVGAGIDPAYASVALGGAWQISDISLPGKGHFEAYRLNLGPVQSYIEDQAFCDRLLGDFNAAGVLWNASAGDGTREPGYSAPTYSQACAAVQKLKDSVTQISHISVLPPASLADFYNFRSDPAGGYFVEPSAKFQKTIDDGNAYLAAWREKYGGTPTDEDKYDRGEGGAAREMYNIAGDWLGQNTNVTDWLAEVTKGIPAKFETWNPDIAAVNAALDSLARSDAAQYGGLKATIGEAKAAIIDPYGDLITQYMKYTQSITDIVADLSKYVQATGDGSKVTFDADALRSEIQGKIDALSAWSLTIPGTTVLSQADWSKELAGNFIATKNTDGTTTLTLDLTNLNGMRDSLKNYGKGDISVTQYNAWYSGFSSEKDNVQNLSQSIAEKFSKMNTTFDDLVRVMSATISALLESESKYFQF